MNPIDILKKNRTNSPTCPNCNHPVILEDETQKYFHVFRGTNDACLTVEKGVQCKCTDTGNEPVLPEPIEEPEPAPMAQPVSRNNIRVPETTSQPKQPSNPVNDIIEYLLEKRSYSVSDANLIIDVVKQQLVSTVTKS